MSFSVRCEETGLEYNGTSINSLYAQRSNFLRPSFHRMVRDIVRFFREAPAILETQDYDLTLGDYLRQHQYSSQFIEKHIIPMGSAIWSSDKQTVLQFPALFFVEFFKNHGFLKLKDRPGWRVVRGGSARYVEKLIQPFQNKIRLSTPVVSLRRKSNRVALTTGNGESEDFDYAVIATHSDQALQILDDPTSAEEEVLGAIQYRASEVILHTDNSLLPKRRLARASWNAFIPSQDPGAACVTYYMNSLQGIDSEFDFCVTLNQSESIDPSKVIRRLTYAHPVYSRQALGAQARWEEVNGRNRTFFCGAYWGYGFHEDGVNSALRVCKEFGKGL
jgi:predicted NAD/FAD-binding protein